MKGIIPLVLLFAKYSSGTDVYSFFDLSTDFEESVDIYASASDPSSEYYDTVNDLKANVARFSDLMMEPQVPEAYAKHTFTACGGVCPWVENSQFSAPSTKVLYENEKAPNIVFVLASEWGWNDVGFRSTYLNWATPNIDLLASEGISLDNYFTHSTSLPSRGALLTGRYPLRMGLWGENSQNAELPLEETTLATELQSAGYKTYMVGRWGMGMSTSQHTPLKRGFDYFYGQLSADTDAYTKMYSNSFLDLYDGDVLVSDPTALSPDMHVVTLYERQAEELLTLHSETHSDQPMFMLYSVPLLRDDADDGLSVPEQYLSRCVIPETETTLDADDARALQSHCASVLMLDEVIGNLTCALLSSNLANNTLLVLTSDTGGSTAVHGATYPFAGGADGTSRGSFSTTALVHGSVLRGTAMSGKTYTGQVHVTDWLPTLMSLATDDAYVPQDDTELDGVNVWSALVSGDGSPRSEIIHYVDGETASVQYNLLKLDQNPVVAKLHKPDYVFEADTNVAAITSACEIPSLMYPFGEPILTPKQRLYDLATDPTEQVNVYEVASYADKVQALEALGESWQAMLTDPQVPDTSAKLSTWTEECGNTVCPWDTTTSFSPLEQVDPHKNSYKPHVIVVTIDNWGQNDFGMQSSYLSWTTPNIDRLSEEAVSLSNYYSHSTGLPSRAALLTGRYPARTGLWNEPVDSDAATGADADAQAELPLEETTLAQELKNLGYMTYGIGRWGLGASTPYHWPSQRGFDFFYGQITDEIDPYTRRTPEGVLDLHNCTYGDCDVVNNTDESVHSVIDYEAQFEKYFMWHSTYHSRQPMFVYYSLPMMQAPYTVPDYYLARCAYPTGAVDAEGTPLSDDQLQEMQNLCASNVMLDELITNMTCTVKSHTTRNNTIILIASTSGGDSSRPGSNSPYRGFSGDASAGRGAISVPALIHASGTVLPPSAQGTTFTGQVHVVDWYPTLVAVASGQQWPGLTSSMGLQGQELDGVSLWGALISGGESPHTSMVHYVSKTAYSVQTDMLKLDSYTTYTYGEASLPAFEFTEDQNYRLSVSRVCYKPSLLYSFTDPNDIFYLYDLDTDPTEESSVAPSYPGVLHQLWERCDYWNTQVVDPTVPSAAGKSTAFNSCGGICPWLSDDEASEEVTSVSTEQIYSYADAPHIVFVLVDDWGWNDVGYRSTYMGWTTPHIDALAAEGVVFNNYFSHFSCMPSRGAFLTGRYAPRLGLWQAHENAELPLSEVTIAQEMKSAGYRTALIGKWHQGYSTNSHLPTSRGFDVFYGYLNGYVDYWTKSYGSHLDLHDGLRLETDAAILDTSVHNGYVLQSKVETLLADHAMNYPDTPLFLYYAMQLIHGVWAAPSTYLDRCAMPPAIAGVQEDDYVLGVEHTYCAMNVMLDEAIGNLTCALEALDMMDNTVMVVVSDNGGEQTISGNSYPFRGGKGSHFRGGISANGFIHSPLVPESRRGGQYDGQFHITDWMPTLMGLATGGAWTGSMADHVIDGVDMWNAIIEDLPSPHEEMLHYADGEWGCSLQQGMRKIDIGDWKLNFNNVTFVFEEDLHPEHAAMQCSAPSLVNPAQSSIEAKALAQELMDEFNAAAGGNGGKASMTLYTGSSHHSTSRQSAKANIAVYGAVVSSQGAVTFSVVVVAFAAIIAITLGAVWTRVTKAVEERTKARAPEVADETTALLPKANNKV